MLALFGQPDVEIGNDRGIGQIGSSNFEFHARMTKQIQTGQYINTNTAACSAKHPQENTKIAKKTTEFSQGNDRQRNACKSSRKYIPPDIHFPALIWTSPTSLKYTSTNTVAGSAGFTKRLTE